jgi:hypothetical protein
VRIPSAESAQGTVVSQGQISARALRISGDPEVNKCATRPDNALNLAFSQLGVNIKKFLGRVSKIVTPRTWPVFQTLVWELFDQIVSLLSPRIRIAIRSTHGGELKALSIVGSIVSLVKICNIMILLAVWKNLIDFYVDTHRDAIADTIATKTAVSPYRCSSV